MDKWEYSVVDIEYGQVFPNVGKVVKIYVNSNLLDSKDFYQALNELGKNGWELVSVTESRAYERFYLKRRIDNTGNA